MLYTNTSTRYLSVRSSMYIDRHTHTWDGQREDVHQKSIYARRDWLSIAVMKGVGKGGSSLRGI